MISQKNLANTQIRLNLLQEAMMNYDHLVKSSTAALGEQHPFTLGAMHGQVICFEASGFFGQGTF